MSKPSSPPSTPARAPLSRPPSSPSPLRLNSPATPRTVSSPATVSNRRASAHHAQGAPLTPTSPPGGLPQKTRARDLLRKHYGLGVGPPAPSGGKGADPMDLGGYMRVKYCNAFDLIYARQIRPHLTRRRIMNNLLPRHLFLRCFVKRMSCLPVCIFPGMLDHRIHNVVPAEIRELDSERQSLVYNHHHELIAASDTIAAVRQLNYHTIRMSL